MSRRRIGQEGFGFGDHQGHRHSSLDDLAGLIDWSAVERQLADVSSAAKGEPAWPPLAMFKAMLLAVWYDLSDVKLADALDDRAYRQLFPAILLICCIGIYSIGSQPAHVIQVGLFGLIGYFAHKLGLEAVPLLLGFVLGALFEDSLRRGLVLSRGDLIVFLSDPLTLSLLGFARAVLASTLLPSVAGKRVNMPVADD